MFSKPIGPSPDWPKVFKEWEKSGQSQRDFCVQRGYSFSRFKNARVKHGHSRSRRSPGKLVPSPPAKVSNSPQRTYAETSGSGFFSVGLGKELPEKPRTPAEVELKLPFGVVLTFRGVTQE